MYNFYIVDIKNLLTLINGLWMIEESSAIRYEEVINKLLAGEDIKIESKSSLPYRVNSSGITSADGNVLVMDINGPIMKYDFCGSPGTSTLRTQMLAAQNNAAIDAIVLNIDSPGGAVAGTEEFAQAIKDSTKPVIAFGNSLMASAAYWIGSSAKEVIISGNTTAVGSIGTMSRFRKSDNRGVVSVYASKSIRKNKIMEDAANGDTKAFIENYLNPINESFINAVSTNRSGKVDIKKEDVYEGDIYIGNNAVNVGLADKIGTFEYAVKRAIQISKTI